MCGIAGIVHQNLKSGDVRDAIRYMIDLQNHRGPDGRGFYDDQWASLGHARLAIIDLSEGGHQPMPDSGKRFWITYNGEIYNYLELASELENLGYHFQSRSDTEVLLTAFIHWGEACVHHLRGMFAFAIWDTHTRQLFCARDRLGIKPFHYWIDRHRNLYFSSEIKALMPFVDHKALNVKLAQEYIAWNLLDHDDSQTMFEGVKRLPPGHVLTWRGDSGLRISRYWSLEKPEDSHLQMTRDKERHFEEFRDRFEEVIRLHLRSDVPVGTSLSGGLDSSAIVGVVNTQLREHGVWRPGWQHVFSACFHDSNLDERPFINEVVSLTGVEPHYVFPTGDQLLDDLSQWLWHQEEPVGGSGTYAQYCVARLANQFGVKVLLDGQGADEQLAGYRKFILVFIKELIQNGQYLRSVQETLAFFLNPDIIRTSRIIDGRRYIFNTPMNADRLWAGRAIPERPAILNLGNSLIDRLYLDITRLSLPLLLRYEDRNSMAFGIEARVPFVDHELVEWLITLPSDLRLNNGWTKYILREGLADFLPKKVQQRKTKLGFLTPETAWMSGPLKPWIMENLENSRWLESVVEIKGVRHLLDQFSRGERSSSLVNSLFRLAIFETWARLFMESNFQPAKHLS